MSTKIDIEDILEIAKEAGDRILDIYNDPIHAAHIESKDDNSPLTLADKAAHNVIVKALAEQYPDIPIISEEGGQIEYEERNKFLSFWLVDPLDGTKEFIKRNGEFTVNIALIEANETALGVVYAPIWDTFYYGEVGKKAFKRSSDGTQEIQVNNSSSERIAVRSKSHAAVEEEEVLEKYNAVESISVGSSLKFCMVAEGKADFYYRHGPTMEWDTAAGQAVVEAAGGAVLKERGPDKFTYNKESLLNSSFLCLGF
ncbi:MAG: 3'(2'),5'-bisphosphate nucleotidase CysQ [Bacteroidota bacterium]